MIRKRKLTLTLRRGSDHGEEKSQNTVESPKKLDRSFTTDASLLQKGEETASQARVRSQSGFYFYTNIYGF